ncbi:MAG: HAD family hydrolase [Chloroflexota bacterium]
MCQSFKAVFFDLDETLRIPTPSPSAALVSFARSLDLSIHPDGEQRVKRFAHEFWGQETLIQTEMERLGTDGFWLHYSKLGLEIAGGRGELQQPAIAVRDWFFNEYKPLVSLAHGALDTLFALKNSGRRLGLISNRYEPLDKAVKELGLEGIFDMTLAAGEIGCWKPNPGIFKHALAQFDDLQPEECLYVGDNYFADGVGAKQAGLVPVIFDPDHLYVEGEYLRITHMSELLTLVE